MAGETSQVDIDDSYASVVICDNSSCVGGGGLVGYANSTSISSCYAVGSVTGTSVGGLIGGANSVYVYCCRSDGDVTSTGSYGSGGLMGYCVYGDAVSCNATGDVTGGTTSTSETGGFVGGGCLVDYEFSYAGGIVSGSGYVGGFIGYDDYNNFAYSGWNTDDNSNLDAVGYPAANPAGLAGSGGPVPFVSYWRGSGIEGNNTAATISRCVITGSSPNEYSETGGGIKGCDGLIENCLVFGNTAFYGGGLYDCDGDIVNCTIADNFAVESGDQLYGCGGTVTNCIIWDDGSDQISSSNATISYSCWPGGTSGTENINDDPKFVGDGNYHLSADSPCIDKGNDSEVDTGEVDIDGDDRINAKVDMGFDEYYYSPASGNVYYVRATAAAAGGDGSSWADAYIKLQDAIDAASANGDEIWVAAGTYYPDEDELDNDGTPGADHTDNNRSESFELKDNLKLYGGFPAGGAGSMNLRDWIVNESILSGNIDGNLIVDENNSFHVVIGSDDAVLDGFEIRAGCAYDSNNNELEGAGMLNSGISMLIKNCTFYYNYAFVSGGGLFNENCGITHTIENCVFEENNALSGAALYNKNSDISVLNCTFMKNSAGFGGGIYNNSSDSKITSCAFIANGAYYFDGEDVYGQGGGIFNTGSSPEITNCTMVDNISSAGGAIFSQNSSSVTLKNSILWSNFAINGSEVVVTDSTAPSTLTITYSDVDRSDGSNWAHADQNCTITWGTGNIVCDPLFASPSNYDFHLKSVDGRWDPSANNGLGDWDYSDTVTSRCVVAGDPTTEPHPNGDKVNMGAYGNTPYASKMDSGSLGSLTINIGPAGAVSAGAKWSVGYDGLWHDSGYTKEGLVPGSYDVFFNNVSNYTPPSDQQVDVDEGGSNSYSFNYTTTEGGLAVIINPYNIGSWKAVNNADPDINTGWKKSGYATLPAGTYTIYFSSVSEWTKPADITTGVTIVANQTVTYSRDYIYSVRYVSPAGSDLADGTSEHPYRSIQKGVDEVPDGGTVYVASGYYTSSNIIFPNKNLTLMGNVSTNPIVDGLNAFRVFTISNVSKTITMENFEIINGKSAGGGGMYIYNSAPTIKNCTFQDNRAYNGFGQASGGGLCLQNAAGTIDHCIFKNNLAGMQYGNNNGFGGAVFAYDSTTTFSYCEFGESPGNNNAYTQTITSGMSEELFTQANYSMLVPTYTNCKVRGGLDGSGNNALDGDYHDYTGYKPSGSGNSDF